MTLSTSSINFGSANTQALAEYFVRRYNLIGQDAEYQKDRQTLGYIGRDTEQLKKGDVFFETLKIAGGRSGAADWVKGNRFHTPSKKVRWQVGDPFAQYARIPFDVVALKRSPLGTLMDIKGKEVDDVKDGMLNTTEFELWSDGTGKRGQVSAISGTGTITVTLTNPEDLYNLEHNQAVVGNTAADGSGTAHTNVYTITDLDPMNGKFTATRTIDNTSAMAANDYIFVTGTENLLMPGIPTFIPSADPADTLYGVTRTANPALSGWRFPFKASIAETIQRAFTKMGKWVNRGRKKYTAVLSPMDWLYLSMERDSRVVEDNEAAKMWGTNVLSVRTPEGNVPVISISSVPDGRGYILDWSTWQLYTLDNLPHVVDDDGLVFTRGGIGTPDGYQNGDLVAMQLRMLKVLLCKQPMSNATFPTL